MKRTPSSAVSSVVSSAVCLAALPLMLSVLAAPALARLPPLSEEAKAKAEETKARGAHGDKVAAYKLCLAMDKVAADYRARARSAGKEVRPATETPPCTDPGAFVPAPAAAASAPAVPVAAVAAPAAPAAAASKP